jgi:hypothetical protein
MFRDCSVMLRDRKLTRGIATLVRRRRGGDVRRACSDATCRARRSPDRRSADPSLGLADTAKTYFAACAASAGIGEAIGRVCASEVPKPNHITTGLRLAPFHDPLDCVPDLGHVDCPPSATIVPRDWSLVVRSRIARFIVSADEPAEARPEASWTRTDIGVMEPHAGGERRGAARPRYCGTRRGASRQAAQVARLTDA